MTKEVQKWADKAMFQAAPIDVDKGPQVQLLSCNNDPLGTIAAAAKMYKGEYVESLAHITDEERRHYLSDVQKNALAAPLEFVNFHFLISGVTRGFTHQMVRQRTATYTQESTRFAVKETVPVGLPPSLAGTVPWNEYLSKCDSELFPPDGSGGRALNRNQLVEDYAMKQASDAQKWRRWWDREVRNISQSYNQLINSGMPAEDARGLLPTNLLTRINYNTSLRGLLEHSGLRLCTQAQFEWRLVWVKIIEAIREYGQWQLYDVPHNLREGSTKVRSDWQFEELSKIFKPICYQKGSCQFLSDVDRHCTIRDRVQEFAKHGVPSSEWDSALEVRDQFDHSSTIIPAIRSEEWLLDPAAARISQ